MRAMMRGEKEGDGVRATEGKQCVNGRRVVMEGRLRVWV